MIGNPELVYTSFIALVKLSRVSRPISGTPVDAVSAAPEI
jgi:hypothetical protein